MSSLERAKAFLATTGKRAALMVLPLAAAAVCAHAAKITPTTFTAGCSGGIGTPTVTTGSEPKGNGVEFTGSVACTGDVIFFQSSGGSASIAPGDSIDVSWNFNVKEPADETVNWDLEVIGYSAKGVGVLDFYTSGSGTGNAKFKGDETSDPVSPKKMVSYSVDLTFYFSTSGDGGPADPTVTIKSLDLTDPRDIPESVPEPSALYLAVPGLGLLLLKRRKSAPRI
jgi:hypothetical protein